MPEKIKINVTAHTADILLKDTESFEFYKSDGRTLNKNAFVTRLIVNYHDSFLRKERELLGYLNRAINSAAHINNADLSSLCQRIANHVNEEMSSVQNEKFDNTVSIKPTKESAPIIEYIEQYMLTDCSLSEYFRNMFSSYAAQPQDEREKIIFKPQYEALSAAIRENKKVFFTTTKNSIKKCEAAPFAISCSKEELHCYLLALRDNSCMTFRISRISSVTILNEFSAFPDAQREIFGKMLSYGPQFIYGKNEGECKVELTARGMEKFKLMYVHRPIPTHIENNCYYFECSHNQLIQYFIRFGKDANIIYPSSVRDSVMYFHRDAFIRYKRLKEVRRIANKPPDNTR